MIIDIQINLINHIIYEQTLSTGNSVCFSDEYILAKLKVKSILYAQCNNMALMRLKQYLHMNIYGNIYNEIDMCHICRVYSSFISQC